MQFYRLTWQLDIESSAEICVSDHEPESEWLEHIFLPGGAICPSLFFVHIRLHPDNSHELLQSQRKNEKM